jgi:NNP family nitrate/nitrite transporter-like MFS transporter
MSQQNPTWISEWKPEDETFWNSTDKVIDRRNLIWSIVAKHIGFFVLLIL